MSGVWAATFCVLLVLVSVLTLLVLGIFRRVNETLIRVEQLLSVGELESMDQSLPMVGQHAPGLPGDSQFPSQSGYTITFLEYGCASCRLLAGELARARRGRSAQSSPLFIVVDRVADEFESLRATYQVVLDPSGEVFDMWRVTSTPTAYYVGESSLVMVGHHPGSKRDIDGLRAKAEESIRASGALSNSSHTHEELHR